LEVDVNLNEYVRRKENILRRMLAALFHIFQQFLTGFMSAHDWNTFTHVAYRVMKPYRDEATQLARAFHDDMRAAELPSSPNPDSENDTRHDVFKDDYYPEQWFRREMSVLFQHSQEGRSRDALTEEAIGRVTKVVEDGARRTLIEAVQTDTSLPVRGFARFDPRPPTCAFCTMMISRGPVYHTGKGGSSAGWPFGTERLERLILDDDPNQINELMNKWHPKCTCIVVPVYKYSDYPTEAQELEALKIYERAVKNVRKDMRAGESKLNTRKILNEMRALIYKKNTQQDETSLAQNVA
jgi:hypothetical protein